MGKGNIDILLITGGEPASKSEASKTEKLLNILSGITLDIMPDINLVTYCDREYFTKLGDIRVTSLGKGGNRLRQFIWGQISVAEKIISLYRRNHIKIILFAFGQDLMVLPVLAAKLTGGKVIIRTDGRPSLVLARYIRSHTFKRYLFKMIEEIDYHLADAVLTECDYMVSDNDLEKYQASNGSLFVDLENFTNKTPLGDRKYELGFIGGLNRVKGIIKFIEALELLTRRSSVIIIGNGEEKDKVLNQIKALEYRGTLFIKYFEWIENNRLPGYLNEIKLLVMPSYKEGLPNAMLESMACGCAVLATPVGGIPSVVKDEDSGFIMEENSAKCMVRHINRALNHPNLEQIAARGQSIIASEFAFRAAVARYRSVISNLNPKVVRK